MRVTKTLFFALPFLAACPLACTSLLGTFEVTGEAPDSGGGDSSPDSPTSEGGTDGPVATDGPAEADAADDFAFLKCADQPTSRQKLASYPKSTVNPNAQGPDRVWLSTYNKTGGGQNGVAVTTNATGEARALVFNMSGGGGQNLDLPLPPVNTGGTTSGNNARILAVRRYVDGVAVLVEEAVMVDAGGPAKTAIDLYKLPDNANAWIGPINIVHWADLAPNDTTCPYRLNASFEPDAQVAQLELVISYNVGQVTPPYGCQGSSVVKLKAGHIRVGASQPGTMAEWPVSAGIVGFELTRDSIAIGENNIFVAVNPDKGGSGPQGGESTILYRANKSMGFEAQFSVPLKTPTDFLIGLGIRHVPAAIAGQPDNVGIMALEADLQSASSKPTFFVGVAPFAGFGGINPAQQLTQTPINAVNDLPFDKGAAHVDSFGPGKAHFLAMGRAIPSGKGFNMLWWDGKGRLRAHAGASQDGGVLMAPTSTNGASLGGDIVFQGAPNVLFSQMQIVWIETANLTDANAPFEVWTSQLACTAQ